MNSAAVRGGHNAQTPGASAINVGGLDELKEDRLVYPYTINYLKRANYTVIDATPGNCSENEDLNYGTNTANNAVVDVFVPIHFNKAYDSYTGAIGSEIWLNPKNPKAVEIGTRILNNLAELGFRNRGLKDGINVEHLHDIRASNATAVLVEVCFCEATEDIRIYRSVGHEAVGKAIAEGITGTSIGNITQLPRPVVPTAPSTRINQSIASLQTILNHVINANLSVDGFFGPKTLKACPLLKSGSNNDITKWLQKRLAMAVSDQIGIFGPKTVTAVKNFQRAVGLSDDGMVGENTWTALLK